MKTTQLKDLPDEELRQKLADARQELFNLRIQKSTGQIERPVRLRILRRDVARIMTLLRQRSAR